MYTFLNMKTLLNPYRAVGYSVLLYVGSFIIGIATGMALGLDPATMEAPPAEVWYAGAIGAVIISAIAAWAYFRKNAPKANAKTGACFGVVAVVTGFILDFVLFLPITIQQQSLTELLKYYTDIRFWMTLALVIASAAATGHFLGKKKT